MFDSRHLFIFPVLCPAEPKWVSEMLTVTRSSDASVIFALQPLDKLCEKLDRLHCTAVRSLESCSLLPLPAQWQQSHLIQSTIWLKMDGTCNAHGVDPRFYGIVQGNLPWRPQHTQPATIHDEFARHLCLTTRTGVHRFFLRMFML